MYVWRSDFKWTWPWQMGFASTYRKEDRGFESCQGVRTRNTAMLLFVCVNLICTVTSRIWRKQTIYVNYETLGRHRQAEMSSAENFSVCKQSSKLEPLGRSHSRNSFNESQSFLERLAFDERLKRLSLKVTLSMKEWLSTKVFLCQCGLSWAGF
jgi:hypothetical protein